MNPDPVCSERSDPVQIGLDPQHWVAKEFFKQLIQKEREKPVSRTSDKVDVAAYGA
jgi:hypothetical protein